MACNGDIFAASIIDNDDGDNNSNENENNDDNENDSDVHTCTHTNCVFIFGKNEHSPNGSKIEL